MRRVAIVGISGAGKSTLARALGLPRLELDGVLHQAGWTKLPADEMRALVDAFTARERWVVDGTYLAFKDVVWARADTVVWLDLPRWLVVARVLRRTLGRIVRRTELWNGNRESWRLLLSRDPNESILLWTWTQFAPRRAELERLSAESSCAVVRLRTRAQVRAFTRRAAAARPSPASRR